MTRKEIIDVDADYSNNNFDLKRAYGKINAGRAIAELKRVNK